MLCGNMRVHEHEDIRWHVYTIYIRGHVDRLCKYVPFQRGVDSGSSGGIARRKLARHLKDVFISVTVSFVAFAIVRRFLGPE